MKKRESAAATLEPTEAAPAVDKPSVADMAADMQEEMDKRVEEKKAADAKEAATAPRPATRTTGASPAAASPAAGSEQAGKPCPFVVASKVEKRPKVFLWGESGSGKTTLALQFPSPVVIDMERGTELYGDDKFAVTHTTDPDVVMERVEWLRFNKHSYKTLVIDSITVYWEALQHKWSEIFLRRNKTSKGNKFEYYDFQPKDWMQMRDEYQHLMRTLLSLDMNVVVTAHSKTLYADGDFMKKVGDTFDSQKKSPYLFDITMQLTVDPATDKHWSLVTKERGKVRKLPVQRFETSYEPFARAFAGTIEKEAVPFVAPKAADVEELWRLCREFGLSESQAAARFETYGSQDPAELSAENVKLISEKLRAAIASKAEQAKQQAKA